MGSSSDLSLGCKTRQTALAGAFKNFMVTGDQVEHIQNLERCLKALEEERARIEAFKRELPFCMQLLNDAIEVYKEHLTKYQSGSGTSESKFVESASRRHSIGVNPTFEEFMPLKSRYEKLAKKDGEEQLVKDSQRHIDRDKPAGWIAQAHPWRHQSKTGNLGQEEFMKEEQEGQEELDNLCIESNPALLPNSSLSSYPRQGSCGAFSPFVRPKQSVSLSEAEIHLAVPSRGHEDCQRASSFKKYEDLDDCVALERAEEHESVVVARQSGSYAASGAFLILENSSAQAAGQPQRKARRCWSPELHRRFVNALQQLGGPQDATPKQIRELMKVDGLTNDEVKSHLQKYRLHTRRSSLVLQPTAEQSPQLVVLGGLWLSPEYAASTIVQQSPGIHEQASEKHTSQCSFLSTRCLPYLSPSRQIQFQQTIFSEQLQQSPSNSNTTPQWQKQFSLPPQGSNEEQEKENNGDDVQSDNTSSRGVNLIRDKKNCRDSMGLECSGRDLNACDQHEEYDDGDVTEAEDSRGSERSLELPVCEKQTCFDGLKKSQIATP